MKSLKVLALIIVLSLFPVAHASAAKTATSYELPWGIVTVVDVKAPKKGKCRFIPITVDIRNLGRFLSAYTYGMTMEIQDDFGNVAGGRYVSPDEASQARNGKVKTRMKVCGKTWTDNRGGNEYQASRVKKGDYRFYIGSIFDSDWATYSFR